MRIFTVTELELLAVVLPLLDAFQCVSAMKLATAGLLGHPDLGSVSTPRDNGAAYAFDLGELREARDAIDMQYGYRSHS